MPMYSAGSFVSKEAAEDRIAPGGEKKTYTIAGQSYTDIKWTERVWDGENYGGCDIITNGEVGEGYYTCNEGELFISVEAVTIQDTRIQGKVTTLAKLLQEGRGTKCVIPIKFGLQIIVNENGHLTYIGRCPIKTIERKTGFKNLILRGKNQNFAAKRNVIDNPKEIVVVNKKNVLRDISDNDINKNTFEGNFIHLNENIEGEYYGLSKRGLYFFVVHIGDVPMRNNYTAEVLNGAALRL